MPSTFKISNLVLICFLLYWPIANARHSVDPIDVLSIHSYHQEYEWTSSQYQSFKNQLENSLSEYTINHSTEYLDTKRILPSDKYRKSFLSYIKEKYGPHIPNLIYVTDDNALNFVHSTASLLGWDVPIVFSGINNTNIYNPHDSHILAGVFEYKDLDSSIKLAKKLNNGATNIIFLGDGGTTDLAIDKIINKERDIDDNINIIHISSPNLDTLINSLSSSGSGTIILTSIGGIRNKDNILLNLKTTIQAIVNTGRKVLAMEDTYLFPGVLGGYINSGKIHGTVAAKISSNIIRHKKNGYDTIQGPSEFVLNYADVIRFNIDLLEAPFNSAKILNAPQSLFDTYPKLIKALLWSISILAFLLLAFIFKSSRKSRLLKKQYTDTLTGLPNRIRLLYDIKRAVTPSLIIIDINNFKSINNLYGLEIGDELLKSFGEKVSSYIDDKYPIYRIGGNQFAILNKNCNIESNPDEYISNLLKNIKNKSYHIGNIDINLTLTAGMSRLEHRFLLPRAEQALQKAKETNKDYCINDKNNDNTDQYQKNLLWAQKLNDALIDDRIVPYFQLISHNRTGERKKYEALVRLISEDGQVIPPSYFLNAAKSTRQYSSLTRIMIDKTLQAITEYDVSISINFTVDDIKNSETIQYFKDKLKEFNVADKVIVELTESEGIDSYSEIAAFTTEIKKLGCKIAIDDFGTGYSNFTHLIHLNVDFLKIDGSIIKNIVKDKNSEIVAKALVQFSNRLGIETIAEFVDSQEVLDKVTEIGIDYSQGYFLGQPSEKIIN